MREMNDKSIETLFNAILTLKNKDECRRFFTDLCTISELKSMSQRMEVALMLKSKCVYTDIAEKTGASTATISRVNRCINYGSDGYNLVIERMEQNNE
ncbi:MAG: TrpR-like protein, YerC/YecD [Clostridia bacterium]|nr:TrpR-like protein, YerC/YecD [Clostridia bacterium]MBQ3462935.1 TrpR-like protein, YerC/YecD [Clostridia bacterium]MBQ6530471.1 TrpR-like protein, YerC/YecD [Clostridia bacterium]MBQ6558888.1 TrpR-like protein, YerC/YecD [Clostridia bacterium]MBQ9599916.1 TrpR-like protein, YerC/YecD [Clostridia bacterium]